MLNDTAATEFARGLATRMREGGASDRERIDRGYLLALGRTPSPVEVDRISRFLALQRDEYQSDLKAARALLGGDGDLRAIHEAEEGAAAKPGGPQSARGQAVGEQQLAEARVQLANGRLLAGKRVAEVNSMSPETVRELAAWTAIARVLLNVDDFMTRN
jgi:hypothetical protein